MAACNCPPSRTKSSMEAAIRVEQSLYGPFEKKRIRAKTNVFNTMYFWMQSMHTTRLFDDSAQGLRGRRSTAERCQALAHGRSALLLAMC
ncbi:hypothetical protein EMIT0P43_10133 [Pseudomonas jessenii]